MGTEDLNIPSNEHESNNSSENGAGSRRFGDRRCGLRSQPAGISRHGIAPVDAVVGDRHSDSDFDSDEVSQAGHVDDGTREGHLHQVGFRGYAP